MRFTIEHFRAVDAPGSALGYDYVATGQTAEVDAHDELSAATAALADATGGGDDELEVVSYDAGRGLYGVAGEDEAVRVTPA